MIATILAPIAAALGLGATDLAADLDNTNHAARVAALDARKRARDEELTAVLADLDRQRAERVAAKQRADHDDDEHAEARRRALAAQLAGWWFATMATLLDAWEQRDRPGSVARDIAAAWRTLVERAALELGAEPDHGLLSLALIERRIQACPGLGEIDVSRCALESDPGSRTTRAVRAAESGSQDLAFAELLRQCEVAIEAHMASPPTADAFTEGRFALARTCVTARDRRRLLAVYERDVVAPARRAEADARVAERDARYPHGFRVSNGGARPGMRPLTPSGLVHGPDGELER